MEGRRGWLQRRRHSTSKRNIGEERGTLDSEYFIDSSTGVSHFGVPPAEMILLEIIELFYETECW